MTVNNRQQTDAGLGLQQATRFLSGTERVLVAVTGCRHGRGGFLQCKSSSYHIYLAFSGQGGQLDVSTASLGRLICRQETPSVNQAEMAQKDTNVQVMRRGCSSINTNILSSLSWMQNAHHRLRIRNSSSPPSPTTYSLGSGFPSETLYLVIVSGWDN